MKTLLFILFMALSVFSANITVYYGNGCQHCETTMGYFNQMNVSYTPKEVWGNDSNRDELLAIYNDSNISINDQGIPTVVINKNCIVVGEVANEAWIKLFDLCDSGKCPIGVYTYKNIYQITGGEPAKNNDWLGYGIVVVGVLGFIAYNLLQKK